MNFNKKSMKYAVAIFTVFAISGLLYTSSITQYGFAQNNSSSNSTSSRVAVVHKVILVVAEVLVDKKMILVLQQKCII